MLPYLQKKSNKSPGIHFDPLSGKFEMKGTSIPEDALDFYKPLLLWLDMYIENPAPKTVLLMQMDYFNTSSSKFIFDIILKLEKIHKNSKGEVKVIWQYEDDDDGMIDAGESLKSNVSFPFVMETIPKTI